MQIISKSFSLQIKPGRRLEIEEKPKPRFIFSARGARILVHIRGSGGVRLCLWRRINSAEFVIRLLKRDPYRPIMDIDFFKKYKHHIFYGNVNRGYSY